VASLANPAVQCLCTSAHAVLTLGNASLFLPFSFLLAFLSLTTYLLGNSPTWFLESRICLLHEAFLYGPQAQRWMIYTLFSAITLLGQVIDFACGTGPMMWLEHILEEEHGSLNLWT